MVHTIAMNEATLVEGMAKFVAEDLSSLHGEANWWHQRVRLVEHWLRDETSRVIIPDDGTEEMIRRHIQRGDSYPGAQCKCWKHIVMELRELPCFAGIVAQAKTHDAMSRAASKVSPSRGKLRPGKDLIVLSDEKCSETSSTNGDDTDSNNPSSCWSLEPLNPETKEPVAVKRPRPLSSAAYLSRRELGIDSTANVTTLGKSFAGMSLLERQMEWLKKKQDKVEAERLRQVAENERELTFQPKLIRRITYSGERHFKDTPNVPSSSRSFTRSESSRGVGDTEGAALLKERALPKVPRLSKHRRSKKKTPLQSAAISQPVGVSCKLLDNMKSELQASLASARSNGSSATYISSPGLDSLDQESAPPTQCSEDGTPPSEHSDSSSEGQTPETEAAPEPEEVVVVENTPPWSTRPTIGGRRADFDAGGAKVRLSLQDASKFELSTMYRKTDRRAGRDGVALHVGRREDTLEEQVIAVLFDREKVTEEEAERWWGNHQHRFAAFIEPQQPREEEKCPEPVVLSASRAATPGVL